MSAHICYIDKPSTANILVQKPDTARPSAVGAEGAATSTSADVSTSSNTKDKVTKSELSAQSEKVGGQLNAQLDASRLKRATSGASSDEVAGAQSKAQTQLQQYKNNGDAAENAAPASLSASA